MECIKWVTTQMLSHMLNLYKDKILFIFIWVMDAPLKKQQPKWDGNGGKRECAAFNVNGAKCELGPNNISHDAPQN